MGSIFRMLFPYIIIGICIVVITINSKKNKDNYLVEGMIIGTLVGGFIGLLLKYVIKVNTDIGLYIAILSMTGEMCGVLIKSKK